VVVTTTDGTVTYANATFRQLSDATGSPVLGLEFFDAFPLLGGEHVRTVVREAMEQGRSAEIPLRRISATDQGSGFRDLILSVSPVAPVGDQRSPSGAPNARPRGLLLQLREAAEGADRSTRGRGRAQATRRSVNGAGRSSVDTELLEVNQRLVVAALREEELKERAQEASNAKSAFLATMSHELRTPLNAIIGYASLLDDGVWGPVQEEQHVHIQRLKMSARHLLALVNDVLTVARVEANQETLDEDTVDIGELVEEAIALTMPLAVAKHLTLSVQSDAEFSMQTDRGKLLQILVNLIGNAIKFTENGEVALHASVQDDVAEFRVSDTGIGISTEDLPRIFEMFWQADRHLTRRAGGSGLGLDVSRKLATLLGGHITAESTPNHGSTFMLSVQLHAA
jgi:signal transduction histidine kinase